MFEETYSPRAPLHFAYSESAWVAPLVYALASQPSVVVSAVAPEELTASWESGAYSAVLLPAPLAVTLEQARLVPGVGVVLHALDESAEPSDIRGEWRAWQAKTELPLPLYVWACPRRAPFPAIRAALSRALQAAEEGAPVAAGAVVRYRFASAEAEAMLRLFQQAEAVGNAASHPPIYC